MLTLEQARALKPGDKVWMATYINMQVSYTCLSVYEPKEDRRFDNDSSIVQYLVYPGTDLQSYIFSDQLYRFSLRNPEWRT